MAYRTVTIHKSDALSSSSTDVRGSDPTTVQSLSYEAQIQGHHDKIIHYLRGIRDSEEAVRQLR